MLTGGDFNRNRAEGWGPNTAAVIKELLYCSCNGALQLTLSRPCASIGCGEQSALRDFCSKDGVTDHSGEEKGKKNEAEGVCPVLLGEEADKMLLLFATSYLHV